MEVVIGLVILASLVALQADAIAGGSQGQAVWLMTITAGDTGVIHLALYKGAVNVDLIVYLTISMIHAFIQKPGQVMIQ